MVIGSDTNVTNLWAEFTFENWLVKEGYPKAYIHMFKFTFKQYEPIKYR